MYLGPHSDVAGVVQLQLALQEAAVGLVPYAVEQAPHRQVVLLICMSGQG